MDCQDSAERLPWHLNGTLTGSERDAVRVHLEQCAGCQAELEETRRAAALFGTHLAPEILLDLAWERTFGSEDAAVAERHLASCRECSEELASARESRALESGPRAVAVLQPARRPHPVWLGAGLAATLLLGFASGHWWEGAQKDAALDAARDLGRSASSAQAGALQAEVARAQGLERRLGELLQPQTDAPFVELLPKDVVRGGATVALPSLRPRGAFAVVSFVADAPARYEDYRLEALASGGRLWLAEGLKRQASGEFLVLVPSSQLPPGRLDLRLEGYRGQHWDRLASYTLKVLPPASPASN